MMSIIGNSEQALALYSESSPLVGEAIRIRDAAPSLSVLDGRAPSLGALGLLPLEVHHQILGLLDVQSLCRLSQVSARGLAVVQSLPAYYEIMKHAPGAMIALSRAKLLSRHSVDHLQITLRSQRCHCCPEYGAYLFLPTGVRCCWNCLGRSPSLRAVTVTEVKRSFALTQSQILQLPIFHTIPGSKQEYPHAFGVKLSQSHRLVSAVDANLRGVQVHGSKKNMTRAVECKSSYFWQCGRASFLRSASESPTEVSESPSTEDNWWFRFQDPFRGMTSVKFASLSAQGVVEHGIWCKGCQFAEQRGREMTREVQQAEGMLPQDCSSDCSEMARSKEGFLEHIEHCWGIKKLERDPSVTP